MTLSFFGDTIPEEIWIAFWQSVARHPKLEKIWLRSSTRRDGTTDAQKTNRTQVMVDALRVNTVLETIRLKRVDYDEDTLDTLFSWPTSTGRVFVLSPPKRRAGIVASCSGERWFQHPTTPL
jgi:hypothetical protein